MLQFIIFEGKTYMRSVDFQFSSELLMTENVLPMTDEVMVMILINNNFEQKVEKVKTDTNGNYIIMEINIQGKKITLVNVYGPNQDNSNFYTTLLNKIAEFENDQIILCGGWNFILDPQMDCENYLHINNPNARRVILNYI